MLIHLLLPFMSLTDRFKAENEYMESVFGAENAQLTPIQKKQPLKAIQALNPFDKTKITKSINTSHTQLIPKENQEFNVYVMQNGNSGSKEERIEYLMDTLPRSHCDSTKALALNSVILNYTSIYSSFLATPRHSQMRHSTILICCPTHDQSIPHSIVSRSNNRKSFRKKSKG